jgi:hypothetical protein
MGALDHISESARRCPSDELSNFTTEDTESTERNDSYNNNATTPECRAIVNPRHDSAHGLPFCLPVWALLVRVSPDGGVQKLAGGEAKPNGQSGTPGITAGIE